MSAICRLSGYGERVAALNASIFLATLDEAPRPRVTLHTATGSRREARDWVRRYGSASGPEAAAECRVARHSARSLERAASIEALLAALPGDRIVFDPTGAVARMRALAAFARLVRRDLGERVTGIYLEPTRRAVYVLFDADCFRAEEGLAKTRLDEAEAGVRTLAPALDSTGIAHVMLGFELPALGLVAIDRASPVVEPGDKRLRRRIGQGAVGAAFAAFFGAGVSAPSQAQQALDLPAVSALNAKLGVGGGVTRSKGTFSVEGTVTAPIMHRFGAQIDARGGIIGQRSTWSIGGHMFWRNPNVGLAGVIHTFTSRRSHTLGRVGGEGELYVRDFTLLARAGYQYGNVDRGAFGNVEVRWYPIDNAFVSAGGEFGPRSNHFARFRAEFQPGLAALPGLSVFAEGDVGNHRYSRALFGVRYYFGETKVLKRRHREDDPQSYVEGDTGALTQATRRLGYGN